MKNRILILILLFSFAFAFGQSSKRTYLYKGHNYGTTYSYQVMEITINSDSSYTWNNWDVGYKKNWTNYKLYKPSTNKGIINRKGNYFILTEYRNGIKTDYSWTVKISKNRIRFYYFNELGKLKMGANYKRIYLDKNETHNYHSPFNTSQLQK